jgi:succinate dehydrogenase cytochrome b subunit
MLALGLHLYHGLWSMFQSLGWNTPQYDELLHRFAVVFTILIVIGFISVPIGVLTGIIS